MYLQKKKYIDLNVASIKIQNEYSNIRSDINCS